MSHALVPQRGNLTDWILSECSRHGVRASLAAIQAMVRTHKAGGDVMRAGGVAGLSRLAASIVVDAIRRYYAHDKN